MQVSSIYIVNDLKIFSFLKLLVLKIVQVKQVTKSPNSPPKLLVSTSWGEIEFHLMKGRLLLIPKLPFYSYAALRCRRSLHRNEHWNKLFILISMKNSTALKRTLQFILRCCGEWEEVSCLFLCFWAQSEDSSRSLSEKKSCLKSGSLPGGYQLLATHIMPANELSHCALNGNEISGERH